MHNHVAVIQQHPAAFWRAINAIRELSVIVFDALPHELGQCPQLAGARSVGNYQKIGKYGIGAQVEQRDFLTFLVFDNVYDVAS